MNRQTRYSTGSLPVGQARSDRLESPVEPRVSKPSRLLERPAQTPLIWRDEWCMGIPALDADHRRLVTLVNALLASQSGAEHGLGITGDDREPDIADSGSLARFEDLLDHLRHHFEREEALMLSIDYDDFQTHKCEHSLQLAELTELRRQMLRERGDAFTQESLQWVKRWCFDHFIAEDRRLARAYADATRP
ncbi:bacteriohemerythrin [Thiocapsa rosea]|uniref:Hemerythrin-like metal-binding protein n=1 Tax=Thiocapsa rosea TaxID=69360 RepID=A0A495VD36_9GAMM|nr:hemerythrin family protein [Thiocapsa rosea]RKT46690.1 hemerythrin-like metal-binding protein [Thiocapsa rosea]